MNRRAFMRSAGFLRAAGWLAKDGAPLLGKITSPLERFKLAVVSDGLSQDFEAALRIMKSYSLSWVEIRSVWGKYNTEISPEQIRRLKELLEKYEFRCSQVDTALFKCKLPGTQTLGKRDDIYPYAEQMDLLKRAMDRAHAWGTDKVRIFSFWRVENPEAVAGRINAEIDRAAQLAQSAGIRLMIEEEPSCNIGSARELATLLKILSANVGANWDIGSGLWLGEVPYPAGYGTLDPGRIWNLHLKGVQCKPGFKNCEETFPDQGEIDLTGQLRALLKDGYQETLSVECEFKAPGLSETETTRRALEGTLKVMAAAIT